MAVTKPRSTNDTKPITHLKLMYMNYNNKEKTDIPKNIRFLSNQYIISISKHRKQSVLIRDIVEYMLQFKVLTENHKSIKI